MFAFIGHWHRVGLVAYLLFLTPIRASAGYDEGVAAIKQGDFATAVKELRTAADKGDVRAESLLGGMYLEGQGVPGNASLAAHWIGKAARSGWSPAQFQLGNMYRKGVGVPHDAVAAVEWYRKAAAQNLAAALLSLGAAYFYGEGVTRDYVQAHAWFTVALKGIGARDADIARAKQGIAQSEARMSASEIGKARALAESWAPAK